MIQPLWKTIPQFPKVNLHLPTVSAFPCLDVYPIVVLKAMPTQRLALNSSPNKTHNSHRLKMTHKQDHGETL